MSLAVVRTQTELKKIITGWRDQKQSIGFVPTMGALHDGHVSLVDIAKKHADKCVVSIFVNPTQFAPNEDYAAYPRNEKADLEKLRAAGTDLVYMPHIDEIYPIGAVSDMKAGSAGKGMEGDIRPHHFDGVVSVVARLFRHVMPDSAVFGEKDYQQLMVIRQMVEQLHMPVEIIPGPIVRDDEGLALSSRNVYLSAKELAVAQQLNKVLFATADKIKNAPMKATKIITEAIQKLKDAGFNEVQYLELRDERLLAAVKIGTTRLIDNVAV